MVFQIFFAQMNTFSLISKVKLNNVELNLFPSIFNKVSTYEKLSGLLGNAQEIERFLIVVKVVDGLSNIFNYVLIKFKTF